MMETGSTLNITPNEASWTRKWHFAVLFPDQVFFSCLEQIPAVANNILLFKEILALNKNDIHALVALDNDIQDEAPEKFKFRDIFNKSVLHPFLVIPVLMFLLQFSGQGAITFYTVQIFKVNWHTYNNLSDMKVKTSF